MGLFNIDFYAKAVELLPPDKRRGKMVSWVRALLSQVQYCRDRVLGYYKVGTFDQFAYWYPLTLHYKGERVLYGQSVYDCIAQEPTYEPPTNTNDWRVYLDYFTGVDERILYNHVKLTLEYSLNKRFNAQFNQPPTVSDIYITTNAPTAPAFIVGSVEAESSIVYDVNSTEFIINGYNFASFNNYTIHIPIAKYTVLGTTDAEREATVRNFADKYNTIGLNYNIQTY